jgi:competence protein ComEA
LELDRKNPNRYRIDLNQANRAQLLQVPGIGDKTAEKIETYRQEHGPIRSKEELTQIQGIGPAKYEKVKNWVTVRPEEPRVVVDSSAIPLQSRRPAADPAKPTITIKASKKEDSIKEPIDVNQADWQELQKLPGIGPKIAQRILDERAKLPFRTVDDLRRVSGIGPKILERLRPYVKVGPTTNQLALDLGGRRPK